MQIFGRCKPDGCHCQSSGQCQFWSEILTWSNASQLPLNFIDKLSDMLWRTSVEGKIVSVVDEWLFSLVILASFLGVQFAQDLIDGPSGEIWAEDGSLKLRVSSESVSFILSL